MRYRMVFALLLFLGNPAPSFAQRNTVQSGEHSDFTRLVAPLPPGATWDISQNGRTVTLSIDGMQTPFDTDNVFDLIPRNRVSTVSTVPGQLVIDLACDCRVAPFVAQDRFVVLDIAAPTAPRPVPFAPLTTAADSAPPAAMAMPQRDPPRDAAILPTITPRTRDAGIPSITPLALPALARAPLSDRETETLNELQLELARELGTATTRGLLDLTPNPSLATPTPDGSASPPPVTEAAEPIVAEPSARPHNMRITSSMDFAGNPRDPHPVQSLSGYECPANALIDVRAWASDMPFDAQIGPAHRALFGEFDKLDPDAAADLAKLYLHFGFGAEALQIIALDAPAILEKEWWLDDIAQIMEFGAASDPSLLASLIDCQTDIALWAILARRSIGVDHTVDPSPALRALDRLPLHLRLFIAPALSERFLSHGDQEAARAAMRNLERRSNDLAPAGKLAQARIAIEAGDAKTAQSRLEAVIEENAAQSPEALVTLVERQLEEGQPITAEIAALVEAYAKELRETPLGPALRRAHVLALARSGQFDTAFAELDSSDGGQGDRGGAELRITLIREMTDAASDVVFLDHYFAQTAAQIAALPERVKIDLATRLINLGFAKAADSVVSELPFRPRNEARQLLRARIALDLIQPERAQAALIEMNGADVDTLRAEAMRMAGDFAGAAALFARADRPEEASRAAWLDENVAASTLAEDHVFGPVLALEAADLNMPAELEGMLGRSTEVLKESAAARATLDAFLRADEVAVDPGE